MNRLVGTQNSPSCLFNSIFKHEKPKAYRNERVAPLVDHRDPLISNLYFGNLNPK